MLGETGKKFSDGTHFDVTTNRRNDYEAIIKRLRRITINFVMSPQDATNTS